MTAKWFERFTFVMRASLSSLREKVEDPERMLHQLVIDMEEELQCVRASVAEAIADEIQLRRKAEKAAAEATQWTERAEAAMRQGREDQARSALEQRTLAEQRAESLEEEHRTQQEQTAKLQRSIAELEARVRQARQRRTVLLARLARSNSSRRINQALNRAESTSAFAEFNRLEERVERSEALEDAWDRMEGKDPDAAELERQFNEQERQDRVQREFEELRERMSGE